MKKLIYLFLIYFIILLLLIIFKVNPYWNLIIIPILSFIGLFVSNKITTPNLENKITKIFD